jgi:hypothetical protein
MFRCQVQGHIEPNERAPRPFGFAHRLLVMKIMKSQA